MTVLFSPVGGTDPISNERDGALLHICRIYKPDIVYLYMSKEMLDFHKNDNRYLFCIEKLGEHIGHKFDVKVIERPHLVEVQLFDEFILDFQEILKSIAFTYKDCEILLNVSSGTPAMKSSLQIISILSEENIVPIQVSTPARSLNHNHENKKNYEYELNWEFNKDNVPEEFEDRTKKSDAKKIMSEFKKQQIIKNIENYNYVSAIEITKTIKNHVNKNVLNLLYAANARLQLDFIAVNNYMKNINFNFYEVNEKLKKSIFEYILILKIKLKKQEYGDFLRAITPVIADMMELVLNKYGIGLNLFCTKDEKGVYILDIKKIENNQDIYNCLNTLLNSNLQARPVSSYHMTAIITCISKNAQEVEFVKELREVETKVRNLAAHEIVSVTEEWIQAKAKYSSMEILKKLEDLFMICNHNMDKKIWNSYDKMNDYIIKLLK